jgi:hypothetical protein
MSNPTGGDLDPELRALLDAEATYTDMPPNAPASILAKVSAGLALLPHAPQGDGVHSHADTAGLAKAGGTAAKTVTWGAAKRLATWVSFGAGAAVGAVGHATYQHATAPTAPPAAIVTAVAPEAQTYAPRVSLPVATPSTTAAPQESASVQERSGLPLPPTPRPREESDDVSLANERGQLEVARTGLARGQANTALSILQKDAASHPRSRLAEERESLMIQALVGVGRTDEARAHAAAFARTYPKSLFLPIVEAAFPGANDR